MRPRYGVTCSVRHSRLRHHAVAMAFALVPLKGTVSRPSAVTAALLIVFLSSLFVVCFYLAVLVAFSVYDDKCCVKTFGIVDSVRLR